MAEWPFPRPLFRLQDCPDQNGGSYPIDFSTFTILEVIIEGLGSKNPQ